MLGKGNWAVMNVQKKKGLAVAVCGRIISIRWAACVACNVEIGCRLNNRSRTEEPHGNTRQTALQIHSDC